MHCSSLTGPLSGLKNRSCILRKQKDIISSSCIFLISYSYCMRSGICSHESFCFGWVAVATPTITCTHACLASQQCMHPSAAGRSCGLRAEGDHHKTHLTHLSIKKKPRSICSDEYRVALRARTPPSLPVLFSTLI